MNKLIDKSLSNARRCSFKKEAHKTKAGIKVRFAERINL